MNVYVAVLILFACGVFYHFTPMLRAGLPFGVPVPADFGGTPNARRIVLQYRLFLWSSCFIAMGIAMGMPTTLQHPRGLMIGLIIEMVGSTLAYAGANRAASPFRFTPPDERRVELLASSNSESLPMWAIFLPIITTALAFAATFAIPSRGLIPLFSGASALASRLDEVANLGLGFLIGMCCGALFSATVMLLVFRFGARRNTRAAKMTSQSMLLLAWFAAASSFAMPLYVWLGTPISSVVKAAMLILLLSVVARHLWVMLRSKKMEGAGTSLELTRTDGWLWGLVYFNPADPAVLVEKRSGPGYTLNFARPVAWPIAGMFLAALIYLLATMIAR